MKTRTDKLSIILALNTLQVELSENKNAYIYKFRHIKSTIVRKMEAASRALSKEQGNMGACLPRTCVSIY